jgi:hypothetical protein
MIVPAEAAIDRVRARRAELERLRRSRRRFSSGCFFIAGIAFGTALYLLRARFATLSAPSQRAALAGLVAVMAGIFWIGARAESEVGRIDEELRALEESVRPSAR